MLVPRPRRRPELSAAGWARAPGCKAFADQPTNQPTKLPQAQLPPVTVYVSRESWRRGVEGPRCSAPAGAADLCSKTRPTEVSK